jgi:hypothetical protein
VSTLWVGTSSADVPSGPLTELNKELRDIFKDPDIFVDLPEEDKKELMKCLGFAMTMLDCANRALQCLGYVDLPSTESPARPRIKPQDEMMCKAEFDACSAAVPKPGDDAYKLCEALSISLRPVIPLGPGELAGGKGSRPANGKNS